jgi:tRNA threonylcarbamoyladenosine biosynthesis protein TsaB
MLILTLRTDKPEAEIGLYNGREQLAQHTWEAHRQLAETLHKKIQELLDGQAKDWNDLEGIVCYKGPGSFTGLRIGLSVANALAVSIPAAIVAEEGQDWLATGLERLIKGQNDELAVPEYGAPVHITQQRK